MSWAEEMGYDAYDPEDFYHYEEYHEFKFIRIIHETEKARLFEFASVGARWVPKKASKLYHKKNKVRVLESIWRRWLDEKPVEIKSTVERSERRLGL